MRFGWVTDYYQNTVTVRRDYETAFWTDREFLPVVDSRCGCVGGRPRGATRKILGRNYPKSCMNVRAAIRTLLTVLVYGFCISLGSTLLLPNPTDPLLAVPLGSGTLLLGHALHTGRLDELGTAIVGLWASLLLATVALGVASEFMFPVGGQVELAGPATALGVTLVLVGGYALSVRTTDPSPLATESS